MRKPTANADMTTLVGTRRGPGQKLTLIFEDREIQVPLVALQNEMDGTHPAVEAHNGGQPFPFKIHVKRWRDGAGPWQYDIVFGTRPTSGNWPHETA